MSEENLLEKVFAQKEEDVETFAENIQQSILYKSSEFDRIKAEDGETVVVPKLVDQISGKIRIQHGPHGDDYVWHLSTIDYRIRFKVSTERLLYAIASAMNKYIPPTITVDIFLPQSDWDIKEYTFKAHGLNGVWNFNQKHIDNLSIELFNILNALV